MSEASFTLTPEQFTTAFPFHLVFDAHGRVLQLGPSLRRLCPELAINEPWDRYFSFERPNIDHLCADRVREQRRTVFILRHRGSELRLRGQMQLQSEWGPIFFLGSPWVTELKQLGQVSLRLQDFAVHDPIIDLLTLLQTKQTALRDAQQLAERLRANSARLRAAKSAAEQANEAKSQMVAVVSHEIRTPLSGLLSLSDMLLQTKLDNRQRNYLDIMRSSGHSLLHVLNDLLDLSKIEAGKLQINAVELDVRRAMAAVVAIFRAMAERKGVTLSHRIGPQVPALVIGDPDRLQQILRNLVNNALKFTRSGSVELRADVTESCADRCILRFEVEDSGIGMTGDTVEQLFQPYTQGDNAYGHGGTGLGLAICKQLVELMGGDIGAESKLGRGSHFWFTLSAGLNGQQPA
ncbi:MAG: ATP-binding protein, partial [Myxococcota bacterium]